jgi:hypothetical protein
MVKGHTKLGLEPGMWGNLAAKIDGLLTAQQKEALKRIAPKPNAPRDAGGAAHQNEPSEKH